MGPAGRRGHPKSYRTTSEHQNESPNLSVKVGICNKNGGDFGAGADLFCPSLSVRAETGRTASRSVPSTNSFFIQKKTFYLRGKNMQRNSKG